jgi:hypothetical protein
MESEDSGSFEHKFTPEGRMGGNGTEDFRQQLVLPPVLLERAHVRG